MAFWRNVPMTGAEHLHLVVKKYTRMEEGNIPA